MTVPKTKKAAHDIVALHSPKYLSNGVTVCGLALDDTRGAGRRLSLERATMPVHRRTAVRELGGLLLSYRRMTAAPAPSGDVAFSLDGIRTHGLIAPALDQSCGLMPCGKPSGLPSPVARSANPHGVAHLLAEVSGSRQVATGASHE